MYGQGGAFPRHKRSYIDDLTPPPKRREMSPSVAGPGGARGSMGRDMMMMEGMDPRDRDLMPRTLRGGSHDRLGPMRDRDGRDLRDSRGPHDLRDIHDPRDLRDVRDMREPRDGRDPHDNWEVPDPRNLRDLHDVRDPHDMIDPRDVRDNRDLRDNRPLRDDRGLKESRDLRSEQRDSPRDLPPRESREARDMRESRELRNQREPRDNREREPREGKDSREQRESRGRDSSRGQRERGGRDGAAGSDRGLEQEEHAQRGDRRDKRESESDVPLPNKRPRSASPSPSNRSRKRQRGPPEKSIERRGEKPWVDESKSKEGSLPKDAPVDRRPPRDHEDSASHGRPEKFSDWSDDGGEAGPTPQNKEDEPEAPTPGVGGGGGRGPGFHELAAADRDRSYRSPSRSSIGSRHSHREERDRDRDRDRDRERDRASGYRSDDMRRGSGSGPPVIQDSWSDREGDGLPPEWSGRGLPPVTNSGQGTVPRPGPGPSVFQGEPHSPLDVASTPPWERANRKRNRVEGSERDRPPPPPPGSFGEAEAAVRAREAGRNGDEPPASAPQDIPPTDTTPKPGNDAEGSTNGSTKLYDDISDDDLDDLIENVEAEVEEKKKTSVTDALDIDWSCLVKESQKQQAQPPSANGSALSRFSPANVFAKIGVSRAYAGEALFTRLKSVCQKQLEKEAVTCKEEQPNAEQPARTKAAPNFELLNDVAALHAAEQRRRKERVTALHRIGPFRRALCARRDLMLRRYLCRLDQENDVAGIFAAPIIDQDLYRQSLQFLRQGSSERKFSTLTETEPMSG